METQTLMLLGLLANIIATVGGFVRLALSYERRMTRIETRLDHVVPVIPKRHSDQILE